MKGKAILYSSFEWLILILCVNNREYDFNSLSTCVNTQIKPLKQQTLELVNGLKEFKRTMKSNQFSRLQNLSNYASNFNTEEVGEEIEVIMQYLNALQYYQLAGNRNHSQDTYWVAKQFNFFSAYVSYRREHFWGCVQ